MGLRASLTILSVVLFAGPTEAQSLQPVPYPYGSQRVIQRSIDPSIIIRPDSQGLVPVQYQYGPPDRCGPEGCDPAAPDDQSSQKHWAWSPPAPYHRTSVVRVRAGGYAGAGVLVEGNFVVTAKHVLASSLMATATWADGQSRSGSVLTSATGEDLGAFAVDPPSGAIGLEISTTPPPLGAMVEYHGFGGPSVASAGPVDMLRHYLGRASRSEPDTLIGEASALYGDSGGPVIYQGRLVGVITGGEHLRTFGLGGGSMSDWPLVYPVRAVCVQPIRAFLNRVRQRYQQQQQQQQRYGQPPPPQPEYYPPPEQQQPEPKPDPYEKVPVQIAEHGKRLDAIELRLDSFGTSAESTIVSIQQIQIDLQKLAESQPDVASLTTRVDSAEQLAIQSKEHVTHVESSLLERITTLASKDEVRDTFSAAVQQAREEDAGVLKSAKEGALAVVAAETKHLSGWTIGKTVAGALGVSGPLALGLSLAGWFIGRRLRRRIGGASEDPFEPPAVDAEVEPPAESIASQSGLPDMDLMRKQLARCRDGRSQLEDQLRECREARAKLEEDSTSGGHESSEQIRRLESRIRQLEGELNNKQKEIENLYVRVPATDPHGLAFRKAINMMGSANPQHARVLQRLEALQQQVLHGMKVKDGKVIGWDDNVEIPLDKI